MLLLSQSAQAQVQNMIVHRTDGTKVMFNVEQVDSVTFEEVLELAETMQLMSTGTAKLAKQIIEKMEGRI